MQNVRVLVTGGNGFIGSHLVRGLKQKGAWVRVFALSGTDTSSIDGVADEVVLGNVCHLETLVLAVEGIEVVFHLAALVIDWGSMETFRAVNVGGTRNVLDAAIEAGCRRFILMSSLAVHRYRHIEDGNEEWPKDATEPAYAISKKEAEEVALAKADSIEVVIVRPGLFPFGPGDVHNIYQVLQAIHSGTFGFINGGNHRFCISYVDNLVHGLIATATVKEAAGEVFVICDDETLSWREFSTQVSLMLGRKPPRLSFPFRLLAPVVWLWEGLYKLLRIKKAPLLTLYRLRVSSTTLLFSNEKAKNLLGYCPEVSLQQGLQQTVEWYKEYRDLKGS